MSNGRVSLTLPEEIISFVDGQTDNRSSYISSLIEKEKQRIFLQELDEAYAAQGADPEFQQEFQVWDVTVGDGLVA